MAFEMSNFRQDCNVFSATNDMDLCWEAYRTVGGFNIEEFMPHGLLSPFPYVNAPSSVRVDLQTTSHVLICKPDAAMITQFNDMYGAVNTSFYNGTDKNDITSSCTTEPGLYQRHHDQSCLLNPQDFAFDLEELQAEAMELHKEGFLSLPHVVLPWNIRDEVENSRFTTENLLKAWAEALEREAWELLKVIMNRLQRRVSATGTHLERVAYYCIDSFTPQDGPDHIAGRRLMKEICMESSVRAFQALYELYPYARFAHFTANQSILECFTSNNAKKMHIVDFDVVEGLQWPPLMEALADQNIKSLELLRITAVKWDTEDAAAAPHGISMEKTGWRLSDYAASLGIPFFYEEIRLQDLKRHRLSEEHSSTLVFNMMADLPHMTSQRSKQETMEFVSVAGSLRPAILTLAYSAVVETHLSDTLEYYSAMLESLEARLPDEGLARSVMEHIFIAPKIQRWIGATQGGGKELIDEKIGELPVKCGFSDAGLETSEERMEEAQELVALNGGSMYYYYKVEKTGNQVILRWRDTALVSASTWRCASQTK